MKKIIKLLFLSSAFLLLVFPVSFLVAKEKVDALITFDNKYFSTVAISGTILNQNPDKLKLKAEYGIDNTFNQKSDIIAISVSGNFLSVPLKNLNPGATYSLRIFDTTGVLDPSNIEIFTTSYGEIGGKVYDASDFTGDTPTGGDDLGSTPKGENEVPKDANTLVKSGLIPCGIERAPYKTDSKGTQTGGEILNPCGFKGLMEMVNRVIHFALFVMVVPIAAILFVYAGFMMITSGGEVGKKKKALSVFFNVGLGLIIAVASWIIIRTILAILGYDGSWIGF